MWKQHADEPEPDALWPTVDVDVLATYGTAQMIPAREFDGWFVETTSAGARSS